MLFLRLKGRRGATRAIIAVAAEMVRSAWYRLTRDQPYKDPGDGEMDEVAKEREAARLVRKLKKLGYEVALPAAA